MNENTGGLIALVAVIAIVGYLIYNATQKKQAQSSVPPIFSDPNETVVGDITNGINATLCTLFGVECDAPVE